MVKKIGHRPPSLTLIHVTKIYRRRQSGKRKVELLGGKSPMEKAAEREDAAAVAADVLIIIVNVVVPRPVTIADR